MAYDDVIPLLGDFGRYQKRIYFLLCLPAIVCAFHKLGTVFLNAKPDYRCQLPFEMDNSSYFLPDSVWNVSYPLNLRTGKPSSCLMKLDGNVSSCDKYIYDRSTYKSSTVTEWNMVCGNAYLRATGDVIFMAGVMVGSIVFGDLSDRCGRKIIFFISLVIQVIFGVLAALAPEFWTFTICRFVVGATTSGVFLVAYVIAMEMVGPTKRLFAGVVCQMHFSLGYMLTALWAYYLTEWRTLQIALTLPGVLFLCYWWFIPESVRWLLSNHKLDEAMKSVEAAIKENKVVVEREHLKSLLFDNVKPADPKEKRATIFDLFRHKNLRRRSLIILFDWFANSMTYYGLSWNTSNLGGNDYINFVISGAVEIPAYTFLIFTLNRWGRKLLLCGCMVTAGVVLLLTMVIPHDQTVIIVTLAMLGKLAITASYGTVYIFSTEQFPTVIRNAGIGAGSTFARIGSVLAPMINLTAEVWRPLPLIVFGACAFIGGCMSLVLPETLNQKLPETIEDGERFGKKEYATKNEGNVLYANEKLINNLNNVKHNTENSIPEENALNESG